MNRYATLYWVIMLITVGASQGLCEERPRIRDLGITPGILPPGKWNAITDVNGVRVGHCTIILCP